MSYEIGFRIGEYEVLAILGAGGMGQVYKVRNVISDRVEAMKVLLPNLEGNPDLADRFMREIKVQASLDHPNIAGLHTALRIDNQLVMLMEYVEGITLAELLKQGPLAPAKAIDYLSQVLSALSYAHSRGIIHRDVKPANIILTAQGVVKLMDFGIAKLAADQRLTKTGLTVGSLYYMSPEQIKGSLDLDPRSDLYSLGVVMYEMLAGARPFQGDSDYSIMSAHLEKLPAPLFERDPNVPPALNEIVLKVLEKDPAKRFRTADAFRNALASVARSLAPPTPPPVQAAPPAPTPVRAQASGHRGLYIALGSVLTILILVLAAMQIPRFLGTRAESPPEAQAPAPPIQTGPAPAAAPAAAVEEPAPQPVPAPAATAPPRAETVPAPKPVRTNAPERRPAAATRIQNQPKPAEISPVQTVTEPQRAAPAPPPPDTKNQALLAETREQFMLLATRAVAAKSSLDNLRRQQAASGLGLRADIAAGIERMEYYLDETEAALKQGDGTAARKHLDAAERETSKLESFLGR